MSKFEFLLAILTGLVVGVGGVLIVFFATGGPEQVRQVQTARTNFAEDCVTHNGYFVKAKQVTLCVGPDGRILGSY